MGAGVAGWHEAALLRTDEFLTALGYLKRKPMTAGGGLHAVLKKELP